MPNLYVQNSSPNELDCNEQSVGGGGGGGVEPSRYRILADHILAKTRTGLDKTRRRQKHKLDTKSEDEEEDEEEEQQQNGHHADLIDADDIDQQSKNIIRLKNGYSVDANNVTSKTINLLNF